MHKAPRYLLVILLFVGAAGAAQSQGWIGQSNDRLMAEALRNLGVQTPFEVHRPHVMRAFSELYPQDRYDRYRLTPIQARAVAYTSLILAANNPAPHPLPEYPNQRLIAELREAVYDLATAIPARGGLFLSTDERGIIRQAAPEIGRMATVYGCLPLADAALELNDLAAESMPGREDTAEAIDRMRRIVTEC